MKKLVFVLTILASVALINCFVYADMWPHSIEIPPTIPSVFEIND